MEFPPNSVFPSAEIQPEVFSTEFPEEENIEVNAAFISSGKNNRLDQFF